LSNFWSTTKRPNFARKKKRLNFARIPCILIIFTEHNFTINSQYIFCNLPLAFFLTHNSQMFWYCSLEKKIHSLSLKISPSLWIDIKKIDEKLEYLTVTSNNAKKAVLNIWPFFGTRKLGEYSRDACSDSNIRRPKFYIFFSLHHIIANNSNISL